METTTSILHTASMDEERHDELFELAVNMAYGAFENVTDDHVEGVYARLVWNTAHGLPTCDAATRH